MAKIISLFITLLLAGAVLKTVSALKASLLWPLSRVSFAAVGADNQSYVLSFEKDSAFVLVLPSKEKVSVSRNFGDYELGKIYPLGELDKNGGQLLRETLSDYLATPLLGYFVDKSLTFNSLKENPRKAFFALCLGGLRAKNKTDFKTRELLLLYFRIFFIKASKIEFLESGSAEPNLFKDEKLRAESLSLAVFNTTDQAGLAQKAARILDTAGGRVVQITDSSEKIEKCLIRVDSSVRESYTLKWLKAVYDCPIEITALANQRASLSFFLGQENWKIFREKW